MLIALTPSPAQFVSATMNHVHSPRLDTNRRASRRVQCGTGGCHSAHCQREDDRYSIGHTLTMHGCSIKNAPRQAVKKPRGAFVFAGMVQNQIICSFPFVKMVGDG